MADIVFRRTGTINENGSVPGTLEIGKKSWPTIERGKDYTFVRKGTYELIMAVKTSGRAVNCLCFHDDRSISSHLIHDALHDSHLQLLGCIAPGLSSTEEGIKDSAKAMLEVFDALGGFQLWRKKTIVVENNIWGDETKDQWIRRRKSERK